MLHLFCAQCSLPRRTLTSCKTSLLPPAGRRLYTLLFGTPAGWLLRPAVQSQSQKASEGTQQLS